ncbi:MurR/RpiR family transcriptional regulator [Conyzicola sp.]|uniref:MurR/RpiR family transcriptional regulator n=1 Tax=Conyzicola sp. TaxID=1969404 RepID=UPI003989B343
MSPTDLVAASTSIERVRALFDGIRLTPTQRQLAQYIVRHANEAAYLSGPELASRANVSQPAVTRLAVALGFEGAPALRGALRAIVVNEGPASTPAVAGGSDRLLAVDRAISHLVELRDDESLAERVHLAGRMLADSSPLVVLGLRVSAGLADHFGYFAAKIHPAVTVIDEGGSRMLDDLHQAQASGATSVLVYALPRYPRELFVAIEAARGLGLSVVSISESPMSPIAHLSEIALYAGIETDLVFDSHPAPLMLTSLLLNALGDANPERTQQRLEQFENYASATRLFQA